LIAADLALLRYTPPFRQVGSAPIMDYQFVDTKTFEAQVTANFQEHLDGVQKAFTEGQKPYLEAGGRATWSGYISEDFRCGSAATPPTCTICLSCDDQFVSSTAKAYPDCVPTRMDDDETAARNIKNLIHETQDNHKYLQDAIELHGNAVIKRWVNKRNNARRADLLRSAMPGLYPNRCADVEIRLHFDKAHQMISNAATLDHRRKEFGERRERHETHLLPYFDQTTLSQGT
jgi:hypothetical protein